MALVVVDKVLYYRNNLQQLWGVWGAIANKMEASQETCFLGKNNPSLPEYQTVFPKKKASIQSCLKFLKAYVEKSERNYTDIWWSGGDSPQKPATFQRIR